MFQVYTKQQDNNVPSVHNVRGAPVFTTVGFVFIFVYLLKMREVLQKITETQQAYDAFTMRTVTRFTLLILFEVYVLAKACNTGMGGLDLLHQLPTVTVVQHDANWGPNYVWRANLASFQALTLVLWFTFGIETNTISIARMQRLELDLYDCLFLINAFASTVMGLLMFVNMPTLYQPPRFFTWTFVVCVQIIPVCFATLILGWKVANKQTHPAPEFLRGVLRDGIPSLESNHKYHFFISHEAKGEETTSNRLYAELTACGFACHLSGGNLQARSEQQLEIEEQQMAIKESDAVLLVMNSGVFKTDRYCTHYHLMCNTASCIDLKCAS